MASPLPTAKQSVSLAPSAADSAQHGRASRIRRDPPPVVKEVTIEERDERDRRVVFIGIVTFTLALLFIAIGVSGVMGWSPRQYTAYL